MRSPRRGLEVIRYADDFVVMCESEQRAQHAFVIAKGYLEGELKLSMHRPEDPYRGIPGWLHLPRL